MASGEDHLKASERYNCPPKAWIFVAVHGKMRTDLSFPNPSDLKNLSSLSSGIACGSSGLKISQKRLLVWNYVLTALASRNSRK